VRIGRVVVAFLVVIAAFGAWTRPAAAQGAGEGYVPTPAFGGAPGETPYTEAPRLLNRDEVKRALVGSYPAALRQRGEGGSVLVWILIDERGGVMSARIKRPSGKPALDASALRVTSAMRFEPALKDDQPVKVWLALPIDFRSQGGADAPPPARPGRRSNIIPWGTPGPMPAVTAALAEPSGPPSLLNRGYVVKELRHAFEARFRDGGARGTTTLRLHVTIAGDATTAEVASSSGNPALDSLALSLKDILVFVPAIQRGRYAEGTSELPIRFPPKEEK